MEPVSATVVCVPCGMGLSSERTAKIHLTSSSKHAQQNCSEHIAHAFDQLRKIQAEPHALREAYHHAPARTDNATSTCNVILPALEGYQWFYGFQCMDCGQCFRNHCSLMTHMVTECGCTYEQVKQVTARGTMVLQTLFTKAPKAKLFPVIPGIPSAPLVHVYPPPPPGPHNELHLCTPFSACAYFKAKQEKHAGSSNHNSPSTGHSALTHNRNDHADEADGVKFVETPAYADDEDSGPNHQQANPIKKAITRDTPAPSQTHTAARSPTPRAKLHTPPPSAPILLQQGLSPPLDLSDPEDACTGISQALVPAHGPFPSPFSPQISASPSPQSEGERPQTHQKALAAHASSCIELNIYDDFQEQNKDKESIESTPPQNSHASARSASMHLKNAITSICTISFRADNFIRTHTDRKMVNDFVAKTKPDLIIARAQLSNDQVLYFSGRGSVYSETERIIKRNVQQFLNAIPDLMDEFCAPLLKKIAIRDEAVFETVEASTVQANYQPITTQLVVGAARYVKSGLCHDTALVQDATGYIHACESSTPNDDTHMPFIRLMATLLLRKQGLLDKASNFFVHLFVACTSAVKDAQDSQQQDPPLRFTDASHASHVCAALRYAICAAAITVLATPEVPIVTSKPALTADERLQWILDTLSTEKNTPAGHVRYVLNIAMAQNKQKTMPMTVIECTAHPFCGLIKGIHLSLATLGAAIRSWQNQAEHILHNKLLFCLHIPDGFESSLAALNDSPNDDRLGYTFLAHDSNRAFVNKCAHHFVSHLMHPSTPEGHAFRSTTHAPNQAVEIGEGLRFAQPAVQKWLSYCQQVQQLLMACVVLSCNALARATEIPVLLLRNTPTAKRNLYIIDSALVVYARYSKTRNLSGGDRPVARFPDARTSRLLLKYLVLCRGLECAFVSKLHGAAKGMHHGCLVFAEHGAQWKEGQVRASIARKLDSQGIPLTLQDIRHHAALMVSKLAHASTDLCEEMRNAYKDIAHSAFGHSSGLAERHYGRTQFQLSGTTVSLLAKYRQWAMASHAAMQLAPIAQSSPPPTELQSSALKSVSHAVVHQPAPLNLLQHAMAKGIADSLAAPPLMKRMASEIIKYMPHAWPGPPTESDPDHRRVRARVSSHTTLLNQTQEHGCAMPSSTPPCVFDSPKPLRQPCQAFNVYTEKLREALHSPAAMFKSQTQLEATAATHAKQEDLLVVMPTGAGKTMCVLLPVFMEGPSAATIMVVPLIAIQEQLVQACEKLNITVGTWKSRNAPGVQLYIFSPEHVHNKEYVAFIRTLNASGRLVRVVVDECHLTVHWTQFRPALRSLRTVIPPCVKTHVHCVLLTATAPQGERAEILYAHGLSRATVYEMPTARNNLTLSVVTVPSAKRFQKKQDPLLLGVDAQIRKELSWIQNISPGTGRILVFALRKSMVDKLYDTTTATFAHNDSVQVLFFYADLPEHARRQIFEQWQNPKPGSAQIMICTCAFGTGVDTPNVRAVIHVGACSSLVQYAQEIGRAGRDGRPARCTLLYANNYANQLYHTLVESERATGGSHLELREKQKKIDDFQVFRSWVMDCSSCRRARLYEFMDGQAPSVCAFSTDRDSMCDVCTSQSGFLLSWSEHLHAPPAAFADRAGPKTPDPDCSHDASTACDRLLAMAARHNTPETGNVASAGAPSSAKKPQSLTACSATGSTEADSSIVLDLTHLANTSQNQAPDTKALQESSPPCTHASQERMPAKVGSASSSAHHAMPSAALTEHPHVAQFRELMDHLKPLCIFCLVTTSKHCLRSKPCSERCKKACKNCGSLQHFAKNCPFKKFISGLCFFCSLRSAHGRNLHKDFEFGDAQHCPFQDGRVLCSFLWSIPRMRNEILEQVAPAHEIVGASVPLKRAVPSIHQYAAWLASLGAGGTPPILRVALHWAKQSECLPGFSLQRSAPEL